VSTAVHIPAAGGREGKAGSYSVVVVGWNGTGFVHVERARIGKILEEAVEEIARVLGSIGY
jgi:hypothetical protein